MRRDRPEAPLSVGAGDVVDYLYDRGRDLGSPRKPVVSRARRELALLRRSLTEPRYEHDALGLITDALGAGQRKRDERRPTGERRFDLEPSLRADEERPALLVAGLFALAPMVAQGSGARTTVAAALAGTSKSAEADQRRARELVGADSKRLPYVLRQSIRLIATSRPTPLDYRRLLADLVILLDRPFTDPTAHTVRLTWSGDFHRGRLRAGNA